MKINYRITALATMTINAWKEYLIYSKELEKELEDKGFKLNGYEAEDYISDNIIGGDVTDPVKFEKEVRKLLKKTK